LYANVPTTNPAGRAVQILDAEGNVLAFLRRGDTALIPISNTTYQIYAVSTNQTTVLNYFIGDRGGLYSNGGLTLWEWDFDGVTGFKYFANDILTGQPGEVFDIILPESDSGGAWVIDPQCLDLQSYNKGWLLKFYDYNDPDYYRVYAVDVTGKPVTASLDFPEFRTDSIFLPGGDWYGNILPPQTPNGGWVMVNTANSVAYPYNESFPVNKSVRIDYIYDNQIYTNYLNHPQWNIGPTAPVLYTAVSSSSQMQDGTFILNFDKQLYDLTGFVHDTVFVNKNSFQLFEDLKTSTDPQIGVGLINETMTVYTSSPQMNTAVKWERVYWDQYGATAPRTAEISIVNSSGIPVGWMDDFSILQTGCNMLISTPVSNNGWLFTNYAHPNSSVPYYFMKWRSGSNTIIGDDLSISHPKGVSFANISFNYTTNHPLDINKRASNITAIEDVVVTLSNTSTTPVTTENFFNRRAQWASFLYFGGGATFYNSSINGVTGNYVSIPYATGTTLPWMGGTAIYDSNLLGPIPFSSATRGFNVIAHQMNDDGVTPIGSTLINAFHNRITISGTTTIAVSYFPSLIIAGVTSATSIPVHPGSVDVNVLSANNKVISYIGNTSTGGTEAGKNVYRLWNNSTNTIVGSPLIFNRVPVFGATNAGTVNHQSRAGSFFINSIGGTADANGRIRATSWFWNTISPAPAAGAAPFVNTAVPYPYFTYNKEKNVRGVNDGSMLLVKKGNFANTTGSQTSTNILFRCIGTTSNGVTSAWNVSGSTGSAPNFDAQFNLGLGSNVFSIAYPNSINGNFDVFLFNKNQTLLTSTSLPNPYDFFPGLNIPGHYQVGDRSFVVNFTDFDFGQQDFRNISTTYLNSDPTVITTKSERPFLIGSASHLFLPNNPWELEY
jgi:hypothetical protein